MKLFVVRHGECIANTLGVVAGARDDSPLTEKGIQDTKDVAEQLVGTRFKSIISSPLMRAHLSAQIIRDIVAPALGIELQSDFTELDVGSATGIKLEDYFAREKSGEPIPGAESPEHMYARVMRGLETLKQIEGNVLLVTHNGTYRMIECVLQNKPAIKFAHLQGLKNGEIKMLLLA